MASRQQLEFASAMGEAQSAATWIHLIHPDTEEVSAALHDIAVGEAHPRLEERPGHAFLQDYGHFLHLVLYSFNGSAISNPAEPFHLVVTEGGVVTWTNGTPPFVDELSRKLRLYPAQVTSVALLLYFIIDDLLGGFFPFLDRVNERIASLEGMVLIDRVAPSVQRQVLELKRVVMHARRILASMRDVIHHLLGHVELRQAETVYYIELYDHVLRLFDTVDTYRELLSSVLDVYFSTVSNRLNEIVKTLTLVTTLMLPASLVAALYGMNFDHIPGSNHPYGFYLVLSSVIIISGSLWWWFRRRRWL